MQILYINRQKRKTAGQESTELIAVCHHFGGTKAGVAQKPDEKALPASKFRHKLQQC